MVATPGAVTGCVALDLLAQAEHGENSLVVAISPDAQLLDEIVEDVEGLAAERPTVADAPFAAVLVRVARAAIGLADEIAPEHLELVGTEAEALARGCARPAACSSAATPPPPSATTWRARTTCCPPAAPPRFASGLSPATFRRRMARVSLPPGAAARLAPHGAAVARAEGFEVHAESMERRA